MLPSALPPGHSAQTFASISHWFVIVHKLSKQYGNSIEHTVPPLSIKLSLTSSSIHPEQTPLFESIDTVEYVQYGFNSFLFSQNVLIPVSGLFLSIWHSAGQLKLKSDKYPPPPATHIPPLWQQ